MASSSSAAPITGDDRGRAIQGAPAETGGECLESVGNGRADVEQGPLPDPARGRESLGGLDRGGREVGRHQNPRKERGRPPSADDKHVGLRAPEHGLGDRAEEPVQGPTAPSGADGDEVGRLLVGRLEKGVRNRPLGPGDSPGLDRGAEGAEPAGFGLERRGGLPDMDEQQEGAVRKVEAGVGRPFALGGEVGRDEHA